MKTFKIVSRYNAKCGRGCTLKDNEEIVKTDNIIEYILQHSGLSIGTCLFGKGKHNSWFVSAEEITDNDEYIEVRIKDESGCHGIFGGKLRMYKVSKSGIEKAKKEWKDLYKKADEILSKAYEGIEIC